MADMKELVTVTGHKRALATIRNLKANGFHPPTRCHYPARTRRSSG
jgi:hypothetical protein